MSLDPVLIVFLAALVTALATGLGALPFAVVPTMSRRWLGVSNALAGGLMLAASLSLVVEGGQLSWRRTVFGAALGGLLVWWSHRRIAARGDLHVGHLQGADARKALMIVGIMTVHSFAEGVGVGVSFGGGEGLGMFISAAIALHNVPEGLAISLILVPRGVGVAVAAWWSIFSSLPQPLMAVPAYLFVTHFLPLLPVGLGLAAGAMVWMTFAELLPEARSDLSGRSVAVTVAVAFLLMMGFQEAVLR
ncbi:MAG TPA: ZIP family metal transporter [Geminicoccaceae bacterium]|nr:ZIP family metal transporter [Geminicoccaceae bacterium]